MIKNAMRDVLPYFDSNRMAHEYYEKMYDYPYEIVTASEKEEVSLV